MYSMVDSLIVDLKKKRVVENPVKPTETAEEQASWLYASNNKYKESEVDDKKIGKWMVFTNTHKVNHVWNKIKDGISRGDLWQAKVSTKKSYHAPYAIMIYTKDYNDLADVIRVLDYLEQSAIKPKNRNIRYKTDQQTRAGIYSGGKKQPWIYSSETVRSLLNNKTDTCASSSIDVAQSTDLSKLTINSLSLAPNRRGTLFPSPSESTTQTKDKYVIPALRNK